MPVRSSKGEQKADRAEADDAKERENNRQGRVEPSLLLFPKKGFPAFFVYEVLGIFHDLIGYHAYAFCQPFSLRIALFSYLKFPFWGRKMPQYIDWGKFFLVEGLILFDTMRTFHRFAHPY